MPDEQVSVTIAVTVKELESRDPEELRKSLGEGVYAALLRKLPPVEKPNWVKDD